MTVGTTPVGLGSRAGSGQTSPPNGEGYHANSTSALTNSLYGADGQYVQPAFPFDDQSHQMPNLQASLDNGLSPLDAPYSRTTSNYGSPRDDEHHMRSGLGLSPVNGRGLSVLDAPLPASFDSNGISNAARFPAAPWPSSVPSKFGLESPTPSLSNAKDSRTSETLKLLHTSAFGSSDHLVSTIAGSPHSQTMSGEEYFGKRAMHSSRYAKPRMLSASLPKTAGVDRDWDNEFAFGDDGNDNLPENYLPENLQDLLTPAEKARRGSMRADDSGFEGASKYGSPIGSSPSRWGPLFQRQKEEEEAAARSNRGASAFGHVGSPLRTSTLAQEMGGSLMGSNGTGRPSVGRNNSETMSMLSQQLQRHRIDEATGGSSPLLHPSSARAPTNNVAPTEKTRGMERHISSGSINSTVTGRFTTPIDEEDPDFVFSMEEEDESLSGRTRKRVSAGLSMGTWGSYAGVVSGKSSSGGSKDNVSVHGRG